MPNPREDARRNGGRGESASAPKPRTHINKEKPGITSHFDLTGLMAKSSAMKATRMMAADESSPAPWWHQKSDPHPFKPGFKVSDLFKNK